MVKLLDVVNGLVVYPAKCGHTIAAPKAEIRREVWEHVMVCPWERCEADKRIATRAPAWISS